jgi:hypothetical protein
MRHINDLKLWVMLFCVTVVAQQRALAQLRFELGDVPQAVPRTDSELLAINVMETEGSEVLHVATRRARSTEKQNSPCLDRAMSFSAVGPTTSATEGFLALVPAPPCLTNTELRKREGPRTAITGHQGIQRHVVPPDQRTPFTEGRTLQAITPRVHLTSLPFDFGAGWNLFTALLTRVRSDYSFAWLRMLLSPAPSIFSGVRPTISWILERHQTQVSTDGLTPQKLDGQATSIVVHPAHDRKTVGKAVLSLCLVR